MPIVVEDVWPVNIFASRKEPGPPFFLCVRTAISQIGNSKDENAGALQQYHGFAHKKKKCMGFVALCLARILPLTKPLFCTDSK